MYWILVPYNDALDVSAIRTDQDQKIQKSNSASAMPVFLSQPDSRAKIYVLTRAGGIFISRRVQLKGNWRIIALPMRKNSWTKNHQLFSSWVSAQSPLVWDIPRTYVHWVPTYFWKKIWPTKTTNTQSAARDNLLLLRLLYSFVWVDEVVAQVFVPCSSQSWENTWGLF